MIAIDTNILIRVVTGEGDQAPRARALVSDNEVFVGVTVLLEAGWVLSSIYGLKRREMVRTLCGFIGLERVHVERRAEVMQALACAEGELGFADALHLALAGPDRAFATFDRRLRQGAAKVGRELMAP